MLKQNNGGFIIDTSTPETLERDFYAWLKGDCTVERKPSREQLKKEVLPPALPSIDAFTFPSSRNIKQELLLSDGESPPASSRSSVSGSPATCCSNDSVQHSSATCCDISSLYIDHSSSVNFCYPPHNGTNGIEAATESATTPTAEHFDCDMAAASSDQQGRSCGMNQLGRTYSPGLPLSMQERGQIVQLYQSGWKICDISKKLCVTHSCVSKILNRFRTTGSVRPKDAKEGRVESPLVIAIRDYRYRLGMTRQSEIREQLIADGICTRETAPSRSSINHILRTKLDLRKKKKA